MFYYFLVLSIVMYSYHKSILMWCMCSYARIRSFIKNSKQDCIRQWRNFYISGNIFVEYNITYCGNAYKTVFVSDTNVGLYTNIVEFRKREMSETFNKRNWVVYASINDSSGETLHDVTSYIKSFCFYFDKPRSINLLFMYVSHILQQDFEDCNLIVYVNDDEFTEQVIPINANTKHTFTNVFRNVITSQFTTPRLAQLITANTQHGQHDQRRVHTNRQLVTAN